MQTSKYLLAAGVLAAVILPLQVQGGPDSEEQARMREALRRALEQPHAAQSKPVTAAQPETAPPTSTEPAPVTPPPQPAAQPTPVAPVAPPPVAPAAVVQTPETFEPVPKADDAESLARAREAMRQKLQEMQTTPQPVNPVAAVAPAPAPKPSAAPTPAATPMTTPVATSNYKPIDVPASPFSAAKQAKLADLLARYRADTITSQEYHAQRAAIIAEP
jgi:DNA polymerase-3 subunit gamma/tau